jgi:hypothetical protein
MSEAWRSQSGDGDGILFSFLILYLSFFVRFFLCDKSIFLHAFFSPLFTRD